MEKNFVVIQPGCDINAADVFRVTRDNVGYLIERGVPWRFIQEAAPGDACFFDRERVVLCVRRVDWSD